MTRIPVAVCLFVLSLAVASPRSAAAPGKPRESLIQEAERAVNDRNWEKAVTNYRQAFAQAPGTVDEYVVVIDMLRMLGKQEEGLAMAKEGLQHHSGSGELEFQVGNQLSALERFNDAYAQFQKLDSKLRKERPELRDDNFFYMYGAAAERSGRIEEAIRLFQQAIAKAPEEEMPARAARAYNYLGYLLLDQNRDLERALEFVQKANELAPNQGSYVDSLGWANYKTGQYEHALSDLLRAERLLKRDGNLGPEVLDHLAQTYFRLGHRDEAIQCIRRAMELAPKEKAYLARLQEFQNGKTVEPVPLDFLKEDGNSTDKRRGRRR